MTEARFETVMTLSDVSVGYGTPQVLSITESLCAMTGARSKILEPDQPERPPVPEVVARANVERIYTANHPYTLSGQIEYCLQVADRIDREKPDVIVLSSFLAVGAVFRMKHRPKLLIYYALEHTDGDRVREARMMRQISDRIDIAVFPEETRALLDGPRLGLVGKPTCVVYNGSSSRLEPKPANDRNGRFFYGGLLHPELTYSDYFLDGALDAYPIDLFGLFDGYRDPQSKVSALADRRSSVTYNGYAPGGDTFLSMLRNYAFSIVLWAPTRESTHFAAPNKFFDAIQAGVPVICAPHPLCKRLVNRYKCGIVARSWRQDDIVAAVSEALRTYATLSYEETIEKHLPIARAELSWDRQFEKLDRAIRLLLDKRSRQSKVG